MTWDDLVAKDPDVIVVMPCGFDLARTKEELPTLTNRPSWSSLRAVVTGRVWAADGNAYFNRPGTRLVEALEMLAGALHPEAMRVAHAGIERL
jgi:iron complex transport system substrate-binding protein